MLLYLVGTGSDTILKDFEAAGIQYAPVHHPMSGPVMNAGETIEIVTKAISAILWDAIAAIFAAWCHARVSRKVIITTDGNQIFHAEGLSVKEIERLLPAKSIAIIETKKTDETTEPKS